MVRRPLPRFSVALLAAVLLSHCAGPASEARRGASPAAPAGERRRFPVLDRGSLEIAVPPGWKAKSLEGEPGMAAPVRLDAPGGGALFLLPLWNAEGPDEPRIIDTARFFAELARREALASSTEAELPLQTIEGEDGTLLGWWFICTDRTWVAPEPGKERWRNMLRGVAVVGRLLLPFNWLDDAPGPARELVVPLVRGARHVTDLAAAADPLRFTADPGAATEPLGVDAPGGAFTVQVDLPGFQMYAPRPAPDGDGLIVLGEHPASGLVASVTIHAPEGAADARGCRDRRVELLRKAAPDLAELRTSEQGEVARASYVLSDLHGQQVRQEHAHAFLAREGRCVDVHVSKADPVPGDAARLEAVLASVRLAVAL